MALISLEEAKSYLRVDTEDEDAMIVIIFPPLAASARMWLGLRMSSGRRSTLIRRTPPLLPSGRQCA